MDELTKEEVLHVAHLARIDVTEEDINKYIFDGSCWVIGRLEPRLMSEKARINNTIGKLKRSYPSLDISKLDITHYRKLSKIKR